MNTPKLLRFITFIGAIRLVQSLYDYVYPWEPHTLNIERHQHHLPTQPRYGGNGELEFYEILCGLGWASFCITKRKALI